MNLEQIKTYFEHTTPAEYLLILRNACEWQAELLGVLGDKELARGPAADLLVDERIEQWQRMARHLDNLAKDAKEYGF